jgi:uncharacterized protein YdiU (UPF0061 family)
VLDTEDLGAALGDYWPEVEAEIARAICWRLGVKADDNAAQEITSQLFQAAGQSYIGWDQLFKDLYGGQLVPDEVSAHFWKEHSGLQALAAYTAKFPSRQKNQSAIAQIKQRPLVTMEISAMEGLWSPIAEKDDWQAFEAALASIRAHGAALKEA